MMAGKSERREDEDEVQEEEGKTPESRLFRIQIIALSM
jgi:hypothetical protein